MAILDVAVEFEKRGGPTEERTLLNVKADVGMTWPLGASGSILRCSRAHIYVLQVNGRGGVSWSGVARTVAVSESARSR